MADRVGGKLVMAWGIAIFSLTSLLMPLALSGAVSQAVAMHLTLLIVSNALGTIVLASLL